MAKQYIFSDANELILLLKGKAGRESHIFNCTDVQRVSFANFTAKKLFGIIRKPARRITIVCKGVGPIEFDEPNHQQFFDGYLTDLRKFCKENRVTFYDFPAE